MTENVRGPFWAIPTAAKRRTNKKILYRKIFRENRVRGKWAARRAGFFPAGAGVPGSRMVEAGREGPRASTERRRARGSAIEIAGQVLEAVRLEEDLSQQEKTQTHAPAREAASPISQIGAIEATNAEFSGAYAGARRAWTQAWTQAHKASAPTRCRALMRFLLDRDWRIRAA
jgi:hypothetical protein